MKILVVNTVPTGKNGITNVIFNYLQEINDDSIIFDYVSINDLAIAYSSLIETKEGKSYVLKRKNVFTYFLNLVTLIKKNKYNAIHIHGNSHTLVLELFASKIAGCNVRIIHAHSTNCLSLKVHNILRKPFEALCTHRLACSQEAGHFMYGDNSFTVINNGIDLQEYSFDGEKRKEIREFLKIKDEEILLGHVGYFWPLKNQKYIVEILKNLVEGGAKYKLLLIGDGELRPDVEQQVKELSLEQLVIFTGNIDNVSGYLNAIDLIIMPSLFEGLPLTLIEQQANGLTCVVSDSIPEEVDKTGNIVFLPLEVGAFKWADRIKNMGKVEDRKEKSIKAIDSIIKAGYSIQQEAMKLLKYYKEL